MGKGRVNVSLPLIQTTIFKDSVKVVSAEVNEKGDVCFLIESDALPVSNEAPLLNMICEQITIVDYIVEGFENAD